MRDSYIQFFTEGYLSKEQFFNFGLKETIYPSYDKAEEEWASLKDRIQNNEDVFIRGFGRDGKGTFLFQDLYAALLNNDSVIKDATNNAAPTKLIRTLTGYSKTKSANYELIRNYQIAHVFGRTKNIYAFTAPWNLVYTPKLLDPFTGHEAKGEMIEEYTRLFQKQGYEKFEQLIMDFNSIMLSPSFVDGVQSYLGDLSTKGELDAKVIEKFRKATQEEFKPIEL